MQHHTVQGVMTIGEASRASAVSAKMIRHYEKIGLIRRPERTSSGYRHYAPAQIDALRFLRRARDLGFDMAQIRLLLSLWENKDRASAQVKAMALAHIADLERRIVEMSDMVGTLRDLAERCGGDDRPECPIIEDLACGSGQGLLGKVRRISGRLSAIPRAAGR